MAEFNINISEFKHTITIERFQKVKDEDNRLVEQWSTLCNARAKILYTRGSEYTEAYGTNSEVEATFYIRFNHKYITSKDRLIYKGEAYDIIYVNNVQLSNRYYEIKAKKVN
ncbi:phage head closure protein [uncultured Clostridium sp.]|uniref:phage head closure protein n=1 Tax=uncultured Clostridium sp. TaxID=59620 RepID=UPI0025FEB6AC|nr:phage head closure protein [uncultured Clostridium sp.]MDU4882695.1 phage head closure protein [Clostridium celatum]MDU7076036.1 phage head closure protein [Clostridium celatum]